MTTTTTREAAIEAEILLDRIISAGVTVELLDHGLRVRPPDAIPPGLVDELRRHVDEVAAALAARSELERWTPPAGRLPS